jgi:hypothetical protein
VILWDAAVVEGEAVGVAGVPSELAVGRIDAVTGRALLNHDRGDRRPAAAGLARDRGDGDAPRDVGAGVGDEGLGAVDDPVAIIELRPRLAGARVGARLRLGQAEGPEPLASAEVGKVLPLLRLGAEAIDR